MCDDCRWEDLVEKIDVTIADAEWAANTLEAIKETVTDGEHATGGQWAAVENIAAAAAR